MSHLLIGGQTGSGKTMCINSIIASLLCRAGPDEVKSLITNANGADANLYNGIPHLLLPVIIDPHKVSVALAYAVYTAKE